MFTNPGQTGWMKLANTGNSWSWLNCTNHILAEISWHTISREKWLNHIKWYIIHPNPQLVPCNPNTGLMVIIFRISLKNDPRWYIIHFNPQLVPHNPNSGLMVMIFRISLKNDPRWYIIYPNPQSVPCNPNVVSRNPNTGLYPTAGQLINDGYNSGPASPCTMRLLSDWPVGVQWVQYKFSQSINNGDNPGPASPCTYNGGY